MATIPDTEVDVLMGTGGTPEGIISAYMIRSMGGEFLGRINPKLVTEIVSVRDAGFYTNR